MMTMTTKFSVKESGWGEIFPRVCHAAWRVYLCSEATWLGEQGGAHWLCVL